jgi:hypothetical protein
MATAFFRKHEPDTRHITLFDYTAAAAAPVHTLVALGNRIAMLDNPVVAGVNRIVSVSINAEFEIAVADVDGAVAVGAACYLSSAGKITATATDNTYAGIVVYQDADVIRFAS